MQENRGATPPSNEQSELTPNGELSALRSEISALKSELSPLKRKYARLLKDNENITHLYKQAAALRDFNEKEKETQMRYNQMLRDNSPDDILLLNTDFEILLCTSSVKKAFDRDITGELFLPVTRERFGDEYTNEVETALNKLLSNHKELSVDANTHELHVDTGGERKSFYSITISPALDDNGTLLGIVVLAHDNTEMHDANLRAEAANRAKSDFLSTMSHEIRTPMNAILGITEIQLQNNDLDKNVKEALDKIYTSGDMLLGIINDILDLSKIEAGKLELVIADYEIASLISDTAQLNIMRIGSKPIEFELDVDEKLPSILSGDELRVKQIFNNLLSNAFKYTAAGTVRLSISLGENSDNTDEVIIVVSVSDTGQGMTEEQVAKLFDEYSRFNMEANRETEGTGLGMSITRNLIRLMNGEIFIESEPGKGSTFTVRFPQTGKSSDLLGREMADNLRQFRTSSRAEMKRAQITREPMPYGSVLIVDDVETNIYVAKGLMTPYGLKIDSADSGYAAIEKIKNGNEYDIVFMDHMMPKMDGIEATQRIRSLGYKRPIVALTANAIAGQADIFLSNGFDDFISKPIDVRQLNAILNKLIRDKQKTEVLETARRQNTEGKELPTNGGEAPVIEPRFAEAFSRDAQKALAALDTILEKQGELGEDDIRTYIINVHGMKSALANLGETELSAAALNLELSGREGDTAAITAETPAFLRSLRSLVAKLKPEKKSEGGPVKEEDTEFLREKLLEIITSCMEYDESAADAVISVLKERPWSQATMEFLDTIAEFLLHSDFDEVVNAIKNFLEGTVL